MNIRDAMVDLGHQLAGERNDAHDLWTWLPSHSEAVKHHGDYAFSFFPSVRDVLREASMFIAHGLNPTPEQIREAGDLYLCPCGEPHDEEESEEP